jgi:putative transposase
MAFSTSFRSASHSVFLLHEHLVFVTKYRKKILRKAHMDTLYLVMEDLCCSLGSSLLECDGEEDHIHLLVSYPPSLSISDLVNTLKGGASRRMRMLYPDLKKWFWKGHLWSPGYFACSCGGAPLDIIKQYIKNQSTPS